MTSVEYSFLCTNHDWLACSSIDGDPDFLLIGQNKGHPLRCLLGHMVGVSLERGRKRRGWARGAEGAFSGPRSYPITLKCVLTIYTRYWAEKGRPKDVCVLIHTTCERAAHGEGEFNWLISWFWFKKRWCGVIQVAPCSHKDLLNAEDRHRAVSGKGYSTHLTYLHWNLFEINCYSGNGRHPQHDHVYEQNISLTYAFLFLLHIYFPINNLYSPWIF